ncbi:beta-1,4-glucuronyltransferase 1 [Nilaparvata lugens]|uniref:beta-1,4-glucuronyltransferase 1 n=1 Tax=Nilaparvata lugens TaxID=108931 RepID=UPI00193D9167|nr:beta-1,4-glucuronyltransferase 1 [Nilaparvata lugens]
MKLLILILRCLQSRSCVLLILISCLIILGQLFQERRASAYKSMFKNGNNFIFFNRPHNRLSNSSTFIPGIRLKDVKPGTKNFCNFRFGDTHSFKIDDSDVSLTPEHSENGMYRVVYNVIYGDSYHNTSEESRNNVTYCTHITPEFFYYMVEIVDRWEGPISISVFVPSTDASITLCLIERLCFCLPGMSRVAVHFIFPVEYPPDHWKCEPSLTVPQKCSVPEVIAKEKLETFRNREGLVYPVNVARNAARVSARTTFVLVSDVELFPSRQLVSRFLAMLKRLKEKSGKDFRTLLKYFVYVLPVFEVESDAYVPETKSELLNLHSQNKAVYFHRWVCLHCQRFPGLQRWLHRKLPQLDRIIQPFLVVKRNPDTHSTVINYVGKGVKSVE